MEKMTENSRTTDTKGIDEEKISKQKRNLWQYYDDRGFQYREILQY